MQSEIAAWGLSAGPEAALLLLALFVVSALLGLPGSGMTMACGVILGLGWGTAVASAGTVLSAALSWWLARTFLVDRLLRWLEGRPRLLAAHRVVSAGGWRLVGLMRLSPALPLGASNWVFALARLRLGPYLLVTGLATLPSKLLWVNLGVTGRAGWALVQDPRAASAGELAVLGLALVGTVGALALLARLGRRGWAAAAGSGPAHGGG